MKRWLSCLLVVASCSTSHHSLGKQLSLEELASSNQAKLSQMSRGMTKEQVIALMGTNTADTRDGMVNNPWTVEAFSERDGTSYEVLYYVTRKNPPFTPVRKSLTTPVVFKDTKVIGWGTEALDRIPGGKAAQQ